MKQKVDKLTKRSPNEEYIIQPPRNVAGTKYKAVYSMWNHFVRIMQPLPQPQSQSQSQAQVKSTQMKYDLCEHSSNFPQEPRRLPIFVLLSEGISLM